MAKRVRLDRTETSSEENSASNGPISTSPASERSTNDIPVTATSVTAQSTSRRPKKYMCDYEGCDKAFDRPVRLEAHVRTHTNDRPFVCHEVDCDKSFFKSEHLKAHIQNKHSDDANHICHYILSTSVDGEEFECGKAFTTSTRLRRHTAIHEKAEELTCQEPGCGQVFRKMDTLQRHIKQEHLHENPFRCTKHAEEAHLGDGGEECGETFPTAAQLRAHENREHAGMRYFCSVCSPSADGTTRERTGFPTYADYQLHLKTAHPPECTICGKTCDSNRALTAHMEIVHSSLAARQEKYRCDYPDCGRGFTRKGNLNVHIQTVHVKKRKFVCGQVDLCGNEKCPGWDNAHGCGSAFTTKASLEGHIRTQHLQLPNLHHPRKTARIKKESNPEPASLADFAQPMNQSEDAMHNSQDALGLLTGSSYAETRPIACWMPNCPVRFSREHDLMQHVELAHGWTIDDIHDRMAEREALGGGQFWIGGTEGDVRDGSMMDRMGMEPSFSEAMDTLQDMPDAFTVPTEIEEELSRRALEYPTMERYGRESMLDPILAGL